MIVLVTGPPAAGKTTLARPLARRLRLPLLAKDVIKEALGVTLPPATLDDSRRLGAATYEVMFALVRDVGDCILESNFDPGAAEQLAALRPRPIQIFCSCPSEEVVRRYQRRVGTRPRVHFDANRSDELLARLPQENRPLPLDGPLLEVDTTRPVNVEALATWVEQVRH